VIGVDPDDDQVGLLSRDEAHLPGGQLHRAFMVLLTDAGGRLLLARRSEHKRLWPLAWADSCAGHPRPGEDVVDAARRRMQEELGFSPPVEPVGSFIYRAEYEGLGCEYELCHVLTGRADEGLAPDSAEVAEVGWLSLEELDRQIAERPERFAPWLIEGLRAVF
jgi:isopentenyl-diphosphate delta-isomerase